MRKLGIFFMVVTLFSLISGGSVFAHEVWLEVDGDLEEGSELQIDVMWGHFGDEVEELNYEDYSLYVMTPDKEVQEIEVEEEGLHGRGYFTPSTEGEHIIYTKRKPSVYSPGEGQMINNMHMGKTILPIGVGEKIYSENVDLPLDIIPEMSSKDLSEGNFEGKVLLEGDTVEGANVSAYGPDDEAMMEESDSEGGFSFNLGDEGRWLIKANVSMEDSGTLDGEEYNEVSKTVTMLVDREKLQHVAAQVEDDAGDEVDEEDDNEATEAETELEDKSDEREEAGAGAGDGEGGSGNEIMFLIVGLLLGGAIGIFSGVFFTKKANS
ncbi:DUF4198 domain-containing protein [Natranaerofaba carboxydovora]|uniref:DUF4198 domain-containing protein n=1 Tax=Natranaerofaba carboxydovora TaxID=2742683 RepID=UPI001F14415D|nr:DUF4198 domain-containing protein [Natranaerofaba carboxydovora]UMZ72689.1 hypothetical protein ACONDI_00214 [Natranaerofaba carboxydovora]